MRRVRCWVLCLLLPHATAQVVGSSRIDMTLFVGGEGGYACYRLPNLVQLRTPGHMLAVVQGHKYDCSDSGRMDILSRQSTDFGRTWSPAKFVYGESTPLSNVTMGTPTLVVDRTGDVGNGVAPGTVFLFICRNFQSVLLLHSSDGSTWSQPRDLTKDLVSASWTGVWTGLPQGIQLESGRLIICANHGVPGGTHSYTIFSDSHGATWQNGVAVNASNSSYQHMGECSLVQSAAGGVWMYARQWWDDGSPGNGRSTRALALSTDGGTSFTNGDTQAFPANPGTDTQGAIVRVDSVLLVGSPWGFQHFPRKNYTILASQDVAGNWPTQWRPLPGADPLWSGASEYSTLLAPSWSAHTIFVIYERAATTASQDGTEILRLTELRCC
jgi:sialidase-1|eukprot:COSAG01_NODE_7035_length_3382_cov_4.177535_2_plen_384_part_00